jgi:hypothetical protein
LKKETAVARLGLSIACVSLAIGFAGVSAVAQSTTRSLLPSSFAGWTEASNGPFSPQAGIAAAATSDYGLSSGVQARYVRGANQINVTLYIMKDASGAYGEYTFLRTPDMRQADLTDYSAISRNEALVLVGNLVLDIEGPNLPKYDANLKALVSGVAPDAEEGPLPTLIGELPQKGLIPRTEHYLLGPAVLDHFFPVSMGESLGFANGAEAELAKYRADGRNVTLLIVDYPTPQSASAHLKALEKQFNIVTDSKQDSATKQNNGTERNGVPPLYENRTLTSLAFVAGATSQKEAAGLLAHLQPGDVLTWNEPTFQFTQPSIGTIVVGTIVGTGIICVFALISGLAFGGVRVAIKAILPGKVFDRSKELDILQLGLSSKPIKSEDFYGSPGGR